MAKYLDENGLLYLWNKVKTLVGTKADTSHTHTKSQISDFPTSMKSPTSIKVQLNGGTTEGTSQFTYDGSTAKTVNITPASIGASDTSHTHNYAGSSTAGGSATSAVKLDTSAGSTTQPVYFSGGKPVKTTYTLGASVPSGAKFTDTTYSAVTTSADGLMSANDKTKLDGIESGAQVNQNAFGVISGGEGSPTSINAKSENDTINFTCEGPGLSLNLDTANKRINYVIHAATTSQAGSMSAADKTKLDGIATGANLYTHPTHTAKTSGLYKITVDASGHVSGATTVTKSDITALGIPSTNTTYTDATTSASGLMSSTDKTKLDDIEAGAQVNQNAFSVISVGNNPPQTINADSPTDTLSLNVSGDGLAVSFSAETDSVTFYLQEATTSKAGSMSATDKSKLDGIEAGANKYTLPTASSTLGGVKTTSTVTSTSGLTACPIISGVPYYKNTTYSTASSSSNGLMSKADKSKLDAFGEASTYALKTDITGMYKYKGSVASSSNLPASGQTVGDVYNITSASTYGGAGMNVVWTGEAWDALGEVFSITSITNTEIDTICA